GFRHGNRSVTKYDFKFTRDKNTDCCPCFAGHPFGAFFAGRMNAPLQFDIFAMPMTKLLIHKAAYAPRSLCVSSCMSYLNIRMFCHAYKYITQAMAYAQKFG